MKTAVKQARSAKTIALSMGALLIGLAAVLGAKNTFAAGFETLDQAQNTSTSEQVEVVEFFWLGCPHCYSLEPTLLKWKETKPEYIKFAREAPALNPSWETHSRGFYTAQFMGKEHEFVEAMFEAIHEKKQLMRNPKKIAELAGTLGMDEEKFLKTMKSFAVEGKLKRAYDMAVKAGLNSVPTIMINGKYRTSANIAGGHAGIVDTINERAAFEKTEMGLE